MLSHLPCPGAGSVLGRRFKKTLVPLVLTVIGVWDVGREGCASRLPPGPPPPTTKGKKNRIYLIQAHFWEISGNIWVEVGQSFGRDCPLPPPLFFFWGGRGRNILPSVTWVYNFGRADRRRLYEFGVPPPPPPPVLWQAFQGWRGFGHRLEIWVKRANCGVCPPPPPKKKKKKKKKKKNMSLYAYACDMLIHCACRVFLSE